MTRHFLTNLAGLSFRPATAKIAVRGLAVGDELTLRRDSENPYDENAIEVRTEGGEFIGFVEKMVNPEIAYLLDGGTEFKVTVEKVYEVDEDNKANKDWMRPLIRIQVVGEEREPGAKVYADGTPANAEAEGLDDDISY